MGDVVNVHAQAFLVGNMPSQNSPVAGEPGLYTKQQPLVGPNVESSCDVIMRGPARLIWPASTLANCGSSSKLNFLNHAPTRVTRGWIST